MNQAMLQVAGSRSAPSAWGDVTTGVIFLAITGNFSGPGFALPLIAAVASAVKVASFVRGVRLLVGIAFNSLQCPLRMKNTNACPNANDLP